MTDYVGELLKANEKFLYSNGDEKTGSELVRVATVTTTHKSNTAGKPVPCVKYKTLATALKELGRIERQKGTEKFIKEILDRNELVKGHLAINHNAIVGGGSPTDKEIEDTEFKDPRLPYFVDVEYVEVGYALSKQWINPGLMYFFWTWIAKPFGRKNEGLPQKCPYGDYNKRQNRMGVYIGRIIANSYKDIYDYAEQLAAGECTGNTDNDALITLSNGI